MRYEKNEIPRQINHITQSTINLTKLTEKSKDKHDLQNLTTNKSKLCSSFNIQLKHRRK